LTVHWLIGDNGRMTNRSSSRRGWRRGHPAIVVTITVGVVAFVSVSFAQNEAKDRTDKAIQPAQTRLPADQPRFAPSPSTSPAAMPSGSAGQPGSPDMTKEMMALSQPNDNHKLLSSLDGSWDFALKFWMNPDPNAKPEESKGTATRKSLMGGRYVMMDVTGTMQMPGPDGKMQSMTFKGLGIEGYDNVKKKFVASWIDNMGTGIALSEGAYDPATKSFTYTLQMEPMPGMKTHAREVLKVTDENHMALEWYEGQGASEKKTMEISYTRKK
jgi:hypothetical protein